MKHIKGKIKQCYKMWFKLFLVAIFSVLLSFAGEITFNFHALTEGYPDYDITPSVQKENGQIICEYDFEKPVYIGKFRLKGEFAYSALYTVEYVTDNGFGIGKTEILSDYAYSAFDEAYTNVNKKIRKLKFGMNHADKNEITQITVSNRFDFNKYRFLFFTVICFLIGMVLAFQELLTKYLEYFFVLFAVGFGTVIILMAGPRSLTWDEQIHYANVYNLAEDDIVDWNAAAWYNYKNELPDINTKEELYLLKQYQNKNAEIAYHSNDNPAGFNQIVMRSYIPMVLFYEIGQKLHLAYSDLYMLGRFGNLFCYVLIIWFALHFAKERKILIFSVSVLPTVLFQGSMYTYDGLVYSMITLGFVLLLNEFSQTECINAGQLSAAISLIVVGSFSKAIYIPMLLLVLALPNKKFVDKQQAILFKIIICAIFLLMMSTFVLPVLSSSAETNLAYSDARGGDTGVLKQIISMIRHPVATVQLFFSNIFAFDNFRNLGQAAADNFLMSNLMFLNFASLGTIADKWSLLLIPLLAVLFFVPHKKVYKYSVADKIWIAVLLLGTVALVWMAMYLSFTAVGSDAIEGVQARYYLPLLLPLSCITMSNRFAVRIQERTYNSMIVFVNGILITVCIYQLLLQSKCF